MLIFRRWCAI